ncbi:MAG: tetratricopeptide repeat protein, partial [Opitutaceae bacterium]
PDPLAAFGLGNYLYDLKRHEEAITAWEKAVATGARHATAHRNLGLAYWNVRRDGRRARAAYQRALDLDPADARLAYEADQLARKLNDPPATRLVFLEARRALVHLRDDASIELAALYNLTDRPAAALAVLASRRFHPWEGGEGAVLRAHSAACLLLGQAALRAGDAAAALAHFQQAGEAPENLGEAHHLFQARADVSYWLGRALRALGREDDARERFEASAAESGDFAEMSVTAHGPLSYYRGLSLRALAREVESTRLFIELRDFATARLGQIAQIDYFATSLPNLLVFEEDLATRRDAEHHLLLALAAHGLGQIAKARRRLERVLAFNRADPAAADLRRHLEAATFPLDAVES